MKKIKSVFNRKPIYIVIMIIATLLLIADLVFYFMTAGMAQMGNFNTSGMSQMPSFEQSAESGYDTESTGDTESAADSSKTDRSGKAGYGKHGNKYDGSTVDTESTGNAESSTETADSSAASGTQPDMSQMPSGGSAPDMSQMPNGGSTDGNAPDMSQMPNGGSMPEGFTPPTGTETAETDTETADAGTETADGSEASGATDGSSQTDMSQFSSNGNMPDMSEMQDAVSKVSRITAIRKFCIPAAVLLALLDLLCIIRLILISKNKKNGKGGGTAALAEEENLTEEEREAREAKRIVEESIARRSRAKRNNAILAICLVAVLVILGVASKAAQSQASSSSDIETRLINATVEKGSIDTTLSSYGTLEAEESTSITIPGNVDVVSYAVANGDTVAEGDLIATVDKTTVLSSIAELQTMLDELDEELEAVEDETIEDTITAAADGRVMVIYAAADQAVVDTMYEHSALMLISLDGLMAADFTSEAEISTGDSVTVKTADGDSYTGKVAEFTLGEATVTLTDDGPLPDEAVTIYDADGNKLADSTLYIHSEQKITGFMGTVEAVKVSVGDEIEAGDTLLTLTDTDYDANYDTLLEERDTLESQMAVLMKAYMTGGIYATAAGVVSGLDTDSTESSANAGSTDSTESSANAGSTGSAASSYAAVTTAQHTTAAATGWVQVAALITGSNENSNNDANENANSTDGTDSSVSGESSSDSGESGKTDSGDSSKTGSGESGNTDSGETGSGDSGNTDSGETGSGDSGNTDSGETGSGDSGNTDSGETGSGESGNTGSETMTTEALAQWLLSLDNATLNEFLNTLDYETLKTIYDAVRSFEESKGGSTDDDDNTDDSGNTKGNSGSGQITIPDSNGSTTNSGTGSISGYSNSDIASMLKGMTGKTGSMNYSSILSSSAASALMSSSSDDDDDDDEDEIPIFTFEETEIGTLTPSDTMTIDMTVDELDILSVLVNTDVQVTLDALVGQSFEGTITHIDTEGTNDGGNTKYTVTVSIERTENMLAGMNANISMILESTEDVLTIPEAALSEEGGHVYVYTGYDEKNDALTDPVEVTTGVSDGTNVEITSGLEEGDTYYYKYADTITYNFVQ